MKKNIIYLLLTIANICVSQNFSITKGEEFKPEIGAEFNFTIGNDESNIYLKRTSTKGKGFTHLIEKVDSKTMKSSYIKDLELNEDDNIYNIYLKNNKLLVFYVFYQRKGKIKHLFLKEYNANSGEQIGEKRELLSLDCLISGPLYGRFDINFSPNNSKVVITSSSYESLENRFFESHIYETQTFKKLNIKKLINHYKGYNAFSKNIKIDDYGNIFYILTYKNQDEVKSLISFVKTPIESEKPIITDIPFEGFIFENGDFQWRKKEIIFCGFFKVIDPNYELTKQKYSDGGVYYFTIDSESNEIKNKTIDYFSKEIKDKLSYFVPHTRDGFASKNYAFKDIIMNDEFTYLIESHSNCYNNNFAGNPQCVIEEHELIISKFNKLGNFEWIKLIPKSTVDSYSNYNIINKNNNLYILYTDDPKNTENTTSENYDPNKYIKTFNLNGSSLICAKVDIKGNVSRKTVLSNNGWCYLPALPTILLGEEKTFFLHMINKGKERYDKLTLID